MDAKGRVVLPREVRKVLGSNNDGKATIVFVKDKRRVYIRSVKDDRIDVWQDRKKK